MHAGVVDDHLAGDVARSLDQPYGGRVTRAGMRPAKALSAHLVVHRFQRPQVGDDGNEIVAANILVKAVSHGR